MDAMQEANENWDRQAAINAEDEERLNMLSGEEDELQLHEDEGTPKSSRKRHHYNAATKLEAFEWARKNKSIKSAAKKFCVTWARIQE
uniref:Brinker DNA-binding domain-containing protein n=1 Tax=Ditylenchus dipsaci TaxID=166011 RepID=A0A915CXG9_9BILA